MFVHYSLVFIDFFSSSLLLPGGVRGWYYKEIGVIRKEDMYVFFIN